MGKRIQKHKIKNKKKQNERHRREWEGKTEAKNGKKRIIQ